MCTKFLLKEIKAEISRGAWVTLVENDDDYY
jgi:hypothetical protein